MVHEAAADPVSGLKWTRRTTAELTSELRRFGINVCPRTVARLLKAMGYSLRVNHKKLARVPHPDRDRQFRHIAELRGCCADGNSPSSAPVRTKKEELVGSFRNPGAKLDRSPELLNDTTSAPSRGPRLPYSIYDPQVNPGTVSVGRSADTPAFAVDCIKKSWRTDVRRHGRAAAASRSFRSRPARNSATLATTCRQESSVEPPIGPVSNAENLYARTIKPESARKSRLTVMDAPQP